MEWAKWFGSHDRVVRQTKIKDIYFVSTVFLGIDHNFHPHGSPVLWETMVFNKSGDEQAQERSTNRLDSIAVHEKMVEKYSGEPKKIT